jgi:hypothetical protein
LFFVWYVFTPPQVVKQIGGYVPRGGAHRRAQIQYDFMA